MSNPVLPYGVEPKPPTIRKRFRYLLFGVVTVFLLVSIFIPSIGKPREAANRVKCRSNMIQIAQGLQQYYQDYHVYPDKLSQLVTTEDLTASVFICPSGVDDAAHGNTSEEIAKAIDNEPHHMSYIYIKANIGQADKAVVYENAADHNGDGMNVVCGDFQSKWIDKGDPMFVAMTSSAPKN